jgi:enoyl-CoA hydratase/carnithine racemase
MKTATAVQAQVVDGVGHLVLDQPDRRNAMTAELVDEAIAAHDDFAASGVKVGLLSATGPVFSAGGDLKAKRIPGVPPAGVRLIETFDSSPILWVAAVHGPAIGAALHLLSTCATVVMAEDAWYRVPEFLHGRYPRPVVAALAEIIGPRRALRMATTGERPHPRQRSLAEPARLPPAQGGLRCPMNRTLTGSPRSGSPSTATR